MMPFKLDDTIDNAITAIIKAVWEKIGTLPLFSSLTCFAKVW